MKKRDAINRVLDTLDKAEPDGCVITGFGYCSCGGRIIDVCRVGRVYEASCRGCGLLGPSEDSVGYAYSSFHSITQDD